MQLNSVLFLLCYVVKIFSIFQPFYFPPHTGFPFSAPTDGRSHFIRLEMHYDNPSNIEGIEVCLPKSKLRDVLLYIQYSRGGVVFILVVPW